MTTQSTNHQPPALIDTFKAQVARTQKTFITAYSGDSDKATKIFEREKGFAVIAAMKNSELTRCTAESIYTAVATVAVSELTLNPALQLCSLVPRGKKQDNGQYVKEATLVVEYKGMIEILMRSGSVKNIRAACVFDCDDFDYSLGTGDNDFIKHKPTLNRNKEAKIIAAYSIATLADGQEVKHLMDKNKIDKHKEVATTKMIWNAWEEEMAIKTVIRSHYKYLPKTEQATEVMRHFDEKEAQCDYNKGTTEKPRVLTA